MKTKIDGFIRPCPRPVIVSSDPYMCFSDKINGSIEGPGGGEGWPTGPIREEMSQTISGI